jgi:hypothetical protein
LERHNYKNNTIIELKKDKKAEPFVVISKGIPTMVPSLNTK